MCNVPIARKIAISPAAALLGMLAITAAAYLAFGQFRTDLSAVGRISEHTSRINALQRHILLTNAHLYRFTSFAANEQDAAALKRRTLEAVAESNAVKAAAQAPGVDPAVAKLMQAYAHEADDVIEMTGMEPSTAVMLMGNVDEQFNLLFALLDEIMRQAEAERDATSASAFVSIARVSAAFVAGAAAILAMVVLVSVLTARSIVGPVSRLTAVMRSLAAHDTGVVIPGIGRADEIGGMAAAVQVFKDGMLAADQVTREQQRERAAKEARAVRLSSLVHSFEAHVSGTVRILSTASSELEVTARSMTTTADSTNERASSVVGAAEQASAGVQTVAAASEQLAAGILEISRRVTESARMNREAADEARRTNGIVRMLSDSASQIGDIVSTISGIAVQTNLLALNATIEAARAGNAGRGFAVVAAEVKRLASQTAKATGDVGTQIARVQTAVQDAVSAIEGIAGRVDRISDMSSSIAISVEQQGAATAEISRNVQRTAASTMTVSASMAGVSRAANDTGDAASQLLGAAGALSRQAEQLTGDVGEFVRNVHAVGR